jgi:hypothetical protein
LHHNHPNRYRATSNNNNNNNNNQQFVAENSQAYRNNNLDGYGPSYPGQHSQYHHGHGMGDKVASNKSSLANNNQTQGSKHFTTNNQFPF